MHYVNAKWKHTVILINENENSVADSLSCGAAY